MEGFTCFDTIRSCKHFLLDNAMLKVHILLQGWECEQWWRRKDGGGLDVYASRTEKGSDINSCWTDHFLD